MKGEEGKKGTVEEGDLKRAPRKIIGKGKRDNQRPPNLTVWADHELVGKRGMVP